MKAYLVHDRNRYDIRLAANDQDDGMLGHSLAGVKAQLLIHASSGASFLNSNNTIMNLDSQNHQGRDARVIPMHAPVRQVRARSISDQMRIAIPSSSGTTFIRLNTVSYCSAESNYTRIHFGKGHEILISKPLGTLQKVLPEALFVRVHQSFLVNHEYITSISQNHVFLTSEARLPVAKGRKHALKEWMRQRTITI